MKEDLDVSIRIPNVDSMEALNFAMAQIEVAHPGAPRPPLPSDPASMFPCVFMVTTRVALGDRAMAKIWLQPHDHNVEWFRAEWQMN